MYEVLYGTSKQDYMYWSMQVSRKWSMEYTWYEGMGCKGFLSTLITNLIYNNKIFGSKHPIDSFFFLFPNRSGKSQKKARKFLNKSKYQLKLNEKTHLFAN